MLRVLLPVDGSENALRAIRFLVRLSKLFRDPLEIHLLNVQPAFPGTIRGVAQLAREEHQREGLAALAEARQLLDDAGIAYSHRVVVGETAELIARYAGDHNIEQVIMGTRGLGTITGLILGSVATKVLHMVKVPVLLVP